MSGEDKIKLCEHVIKKLENDLAACNDQSFKAREIKNKLEKMKSSLKKLRNEKNTDEPLCEIKKTEPENSPATPLTSNKRKSKDTCKLIVTAITIVGIVIAAIFTNIYLRENKLLIYASGTGHKAFFNSTWKMSPREIERANNIKLSKSSRFSKLFSVISTGVPEVADNKRFKVLFNKGGIDLWGYSTKVNYIFFDNMLYAYIVNLKVYSLEEHKKILSTLRDQFGEGTTDKEKSKPIVFSFNWETEEQTISYSFWEKDEESESYRVNIRSVYKPLLSDINKIASDEESSYF
jgi:hypothetical protein